MLGAIRCGQESSLCEEGSALDGTNKKTATIKFIFEGAGADDDPFLTPKHYEMTLNRLSRSISSVAIIRAIMGYSSTDSKTCGAIATI